MCSEPRRAVWLAEAAAGRAWGELAQVILGGGLALREPERRREFILVEELYFAFLLVRIRSPLGNLKFVKNPGTPPGKRTIANKIKMSPCLPWWRRVASAVPSDSDVREGFEAFGGSCFADAQLLFGGSVHAWLASIHRSRHRATILHVLIH